MWKYRLQFYTRLFFSFVVGVLVILTAVLVIKYILDVFPIITVPVLGSIVLFSMKLKHILGIGKAIDGEYLTPNKDYAPYFLRFYICWRYGQDIEKKLCSIANARRIHLSWPLKFYVDGTRGKHLSCVLEACVIAKREDFLPEVVELLIRFLRANIGFTENTSYTELGQLELKLIEDRKKLEKLMTT